MNRRTEKIRIQQLETNVTSLQQDIDFLHDRTKQLEGLIKNLTCKLESLWNAPPR